MHKTRLALLIMLAGTLAACGESSTLQVSDGTGPSPQLPEPNNPLIPTVNIGPAIGWPEGVVIDQQGDLLVADDVGNKVWRVSAAQ